MLTAESKLVPDDSVVYTEMQNGEAVLLHLGQSQYYSLNETGSFIWQGMKAGLALGEISAGLQEKFEVTAEHALQSVIDLLEVLAAEDLVHQANG